VLNQMLQTVATAKVPSYMDKKYGDQILQTIDIIREKAPGIRLDYFFNLWIEYWFGEQTRNAAHIAVIGVDVPELYIWALGAKPLNIFGGCFFTDKYADNVFPQISDPIVKSAFSLLFSKQLVSVQKLKALVVPIRNVDMRKALPYFRDLGCPVIAMDQEPFWSPKATLAFKESHKRFVRQLQRPTNQVVTKKNIYTTAEQITKAHLALKRLDQTRMPEIARSFIRQTYYLAPDIAEWTQATNSIALEKPQPTTDYLPHLLLTGSPLYFPNLKIPYVLHRVGITNYVNSCGTPYPEDYSELLDNGAPTLNSLTDRLHELHYRSAHKSLDLALRSDTSLLRNYDGVIYHLLKGQLTFAYEADRMEKAAIRLRVPFVCIETDYTNADTEQVRIRLEAFSELLTQSVGRHQPLRLCKDKGEYHAARTTTET
jgi:benzoyl-CoA reductase/2-hydroxyglutaryl-CoA dehydratase subunit BcrC/BadD/HgdB